MYSQITIQTKFLDEEEYFYFIEDFPLFSMNQYIKLPNDRSNESMRSHWGSLSDFEILKLFLKMMKNWNLISRVSQKDIHHIFLLNI